MDRGKISVGEESGAVCMITSTHSSDNVHIMRERKSGRRKKRGGREAWGIAQKEGGKMHHFVRLKTPGVTGLYGVWGD